MKKIYKGQPGYTRSRKLKLGMASLTGFMIMVAIFIVGYAIYQTPKNYLTIPAVIVVLPTAKVFVQYLMVSWKNSVEPSEYNALSKAVAPLPLYCELAITASEKSYEILYLLIDREENIIAYTKKTDKVDTEKFEKGVTNFLNFYDYSAKVKLYTDYRQFEKKAGYFAARNSSITVEEKEHIQTVFEKLSIMSI